jgi:hypothetical protein
LAGLAIQAVADIRNKSALIGHGVPERAACTATFQFILPLGVQLVLPVMLRNPQLCSNLLRLLSDEYNSPPNVCSGSKAAFVWLEWTVN